MRATTIQDSLDLLEWRNAIEVRKISRNQALIPKKVHKHWLLNRLNLQPHEPFWMFESARGKIGCVRFDSTEIQNQFAISLIINPLFRGEGYGKIILGQAINEFLARNPAVSFHAEVHKSNLISRSLFLSSGFKEFGSDKNFLLFKRSTNLH
jgi:RimJ/RimL family protein N-acetyltransferase